MKTSFETKLVSITKPEIYSDGKLLTPEEFIAYTARVSNPSNQLNTETAPKLLGYLIKHKHWSPFEMVNMCVEIKTSRGVAPQILRHRSFQFQEFSQRYQAVDGSGIIIYAARRQDIKNRQNSVDDVPENIKAEWEARQLENWKQSFEHYKWALDNNIAKECARFVLPLGTQTTMYMSGTARSWLHYIQVRTDQSVQIEHKEIAEGCKKLFVQSFPATSEAMGWANV